MHLFTVLCNKQQREMTKFCVVFLQKRRPRQVDYNAKWDHKAWLGLDLISDSLLGDTDLLFTDHDKQGSVHTWCPSTSTRAPAQNGAVFRHWVPDISLPSSVREYKVETLYLGTGAEFWRGFLKKWFVHISAHQKSFSGTAL